MLTLLVGILMIVIFFRFLGLLFRGGGGALLICLGLIFFPLITIGLLVLGLAVFALPLIIVVGIIALCIRAAI